MQKAATALLAAAVSLLAGQAAVAGAPLKGVDVKLGKNPGGGIVARTTTDANGGFVFDNLPAGDYQIQIMTAEPEAKTTATAARSHIRYQGISATNGSVVATIGAELGAGPVTSNIAIAAGHGKIVGTVTRATAPGAGGLR